MVLGLVAGIVVVIIIVIITLNVIIIGHNKAFCLAFSGEGKRRCGVDYINETNENATASLACAL